MEELFIIPEGVRGIGKTLDPVVEFCTNVIKILDTLLTILKGTAFIGLVGGAVWIAFIEAIKPYIEDLIKKLTELSSDVNRAADQHEGKDVEGSRFFTPS